MAAWDIKKYLMEPASDSTDTQKTVETTGNPEEKGSIETQVNERVREEFMRQIREKKVPHSVSAGRVSVAKFAV